MHLLVSPDDPDHVKRIKEFLASLKLSIDGEDYFCEPSSLMRLGRRHDPSLKGNDKAALAVGVRQFKVNREQLHQKLKNRWASENVLTAVSVSGNDGTARLQADASFAAVRQDIEKSASIMFSSHENQRSFWLGRGKITGSRVRRPIWRTEAVHSRRRCTRCGARWQARRRPLHLDKGRFVLRIAPADLLRAGSARRDRPYAAGRRTAVADYFRTVSLTNAPWFQSCGSVPLNPGLVGIIGAPGIW